MKMCLMDGDDMKRQKKAAVLVCVLLTVLNTTACGQGKKDENVPIEESAASQQENDAQAEGAPDSEMADDIPGTYGCPNDDSTLSISVDTDRFYHAEVLLFRLTMVDDFTGKYENGILAMTGTDAAGDPIAVEITFSNGEATLTVTDSTWEYLENGTQYVFYKE